MNTGLNIWLLQAVEIHNRNPLPLPQNAWSKNAEEQINDKPSTSRPHMYLFPLEYQCTGSSFFLLSSLESQMTAWFGIWAPEGLSLVPHVSLSNRSHIWSTLISTCHLHQDFADSIPNCWRGLNFEPSRKNFRKGSFAVVNCKINISPSQGAEFPSPLVGFPLARRELLGPDLLGQF